MKTPYNLTPDDDWCVTESSPVFAGPPYRCVGTLGVKNMSERKLKVRYLPTVSESQGFICEQMLCQTNIRPGAEQSVEARLAMGKHTPPGNYAVKIPLGQQTLAAKVEVFENEALNMQPRRLSMEGRPGVRVSRSIQFHNQGNTSITLPGRSMLWLEERNWVGHSLVQTVRSIKDDDDYEAYMDALISQFKQSMLPSIPVDFDLDESAGDPPKKGPDLSLAPGDRVTRRVSIKLPEGLRKGKTYHGFVKIRKFRFWIEIFCDQGVLKGSQPA